MIRKISNFNPEEYKKEFYEWLQENAGTFFDEEMSAWFFEYIDKRFDILENQIYEFRHDMDLKLENKKDVF